MGDGTAHSFNFGSIQAGNEYLIGISWDGTDLKCYINGNLEHTEANAPFAWHATIRKITK